MGTTMTVSRRDFIKVVSVAGGGLMLGFRIPSGTSPDEKGLLEPNAWLKIDTMGQVTVIVGRSEMGQGVATAMPMIVAEELEADWSKVTWQQADAHPDKYGDMTTGGSRSVRGFYHEMRMAGATAREMLIAAAAKYWNVAPTSCKAQKGMVIHSSGKKLTYGQLVNDAANLPVPADVKLKDPKHFTILRTNMPRFDTPPKVYATAEFCSDIRVPGMVYASIERCPYVGGRAAEFDASKARLIRGVRNVIEVKTGIAVVADSTWAAFRGREALTVTWNKGPWSTQSTEKIRTMFVESSKITGTSSRSDGDAQAAFDSAPTKVEAVYEAPFVAHATMEPMTCIAHVKDGECEIWAPTQSPQGAQNTAADILGLPVEKVTVHVTLIGGGFGRRLNSDFVDDAVRVSQKVGAPVKIVWTRADDMKHDWFRPGTYNVIKAGLDAKGMPVSWMHRIVGPESRGLVMGGSNPPYDVPNVLIDYHLKDTGVRLGAWRSVGPSQNAFVIESFVDELAHAAKKDPFEYRKAIMDRSPRLRRAMEYAAQKAGWGTRLPVGVGRGISAVESFGSSAAQVAEVSVRDRRVVIHRIVTAVDCGPYVNPDTIKSQIESAVAMALSAALKDEITVQDGQIVQSNFDDYRIFTMRDMPKVEVHIMESDEPIGGIGEPALPPTAPAVCNAIFAASGIRIRRLPIRPEDLRKG